MTADSYSSLERMLPDLTTALLKCIPDFRQVEEACTECGEKHILISGKYDIVACPTCHIIVMRLKLEI